MKIEWVNHASFIVDHDGVRLMSDPWIEGTAFDHGWSHLVPTRFGYDDFAVVSHIWISHEHPDHFAPRNLLAIPAEHRRRITLMFHEGVDFRIGAFCRNAGFGRVLQLRSGRWLDLAPDLRVRCEEEAGDTWLALRSADRTILNLNDAIFAYRWRVRRVARRVGARIDVLLTQFSYANWVGNPDQPERHHAAARDMLERVRMQVDILKPRYTIPFASMVRFCHEENAYLNAGMNRVHDAYRMLRSTSTTPVVLFPGESWTVGEPHDSERSLARYTPFYERAASGEDLVRSPSVGATELTRLADRFLRTLRRRNGSWPIALATRLGLLASTTIWVWDHGAAYELDPRRGLRRAQLDERGCDVAMASESLAYALRFLWGGSTVLINGRFRTPPAGRSRRFMRYVNLALLNNWGWDKVRYLRHRAASIRDRAERRLAWVG